MKNVSKDKLKKCIFLSDDEFEGIMYHLGIHVETGWEGIFYSKNEDDVDDSEVYELLSEYFDVEVTSAHCDDCDYMGVWVVYREKDDLK